MPVSKKIFIISATILGILLVFLGIYQLNFKSDTSSQPVADSQNSNTQKDLVNTSNQAKITLISDKLAKYPFVDFEGAHIQYYSPETASISQMNLDGTGGMKLFIKNVAGLTGLVWAPTGSRAILKFDRGYEYYNRDNGTSVPIKTMDTVFWQNVNKIFYKYYDPKTKERSLNIANPDGSDWLKISDIDFARVDIAPIPKSGMVSLWNSSNALQETNLESIPIAGGDKKILFSGKFGADYLWNGSGDRILISHSDQKGGSKIQLAVANGQGGEYQNLNVSTFVSKCVWSSDNVTVFCAVPTDLPATAVLPNDYWSGKIQTKDAFFKINTKTGEKTSLISPTKIPTDIDASNLSINAQDNILIFLNKLDSKLYKLEF